MKRKMKLLAGLFCLLVFFGAGSAKAMATEEVTVYVSVEKFVLGQGYVVTPVRKTVAEGTNVFDLIENVLKEEKYTILKRYTTDLGWYLEGIEKADSGKTLVPFAVINSGNYSYKDIYPSGVLPKKENEEYPNLCEYSYQADGFSSGWCYYVNNYYPVFGMAEYIVKDQDVIRVQFTLGMGDLNLIGDIDSGTKSMAMIKEYLKEENTDTEIRSIYERSLEILCKMDVVPSDIQEIQDILGNVSLDLDDGKKDDDHSSDSDRIKIIYDRIKIQEAEDRIRMLPKTVTLDDGEMIKEVRSLYLALTPEQRDLISKESKELLNTAWNEWNRLLKEKENREAAAKVVKQINAIGTVTLAKESVISAARKAYNALSKEAKAYIPSAVLSKLISAEKKIRSLKKAEEIKKYTPAKVKIRKISLTKKKVKLTWKKISSASGYEIQMSTKKTSGFKKIVTIKKAKTVTYTKKKLPSKKTRYFRIRAFRKVGKTTYYGKFSAVKKIKVK